MKFPHLFGGGGKGKKLPIRTGQTEVDHCLAGHKILDTQIRELKKYVQAYLENMKKSSESSSQVGKQIHSILTGTRVEESSETYTRVLQRCDEEIPSRLLTIANDHILEPLVAYEKDLDAFIPDLKKLQEKQTSVNHYSEKVEKMTTKGITMQKEEEKLMRNKGKLGEATGERDQLVEDLTRRMERLQRLKVNTIKPIYKALFQFQQQWHKQKAEALDVPIPWIATTTSTATTLNSQSSASPPKSPAQTSKRFDANGNPIVVNSQQTSFQPQNVEQTSTGNGRTSSVPPIGVGQSQTNSHSNLKGPIEFFHTVPDHEIAEFENSRSFKFPNMEPKPTLQPRPKSTTDVRSEELMDKW
eukprot:CAMPEP_0204881002 /NCGR_PEP_ID=MMETSP1349-20130617/2336_1 /ASSEMBLY_ACC=CAM_ASM_000710 /TAXON_ID=215587 /ORGANISM="Aplanochytrium stocchinoi, Strain GSBS06" /LENGTH=356 /DNA_ID=CAMNT_0052039753 /DNA_START=145 /DNA_END=1212 /DNA_ORIENTATION=-